MQQTMKSYLPRNIKQYKKTNASINEKSSITKTIYEKKKHKIFSPPQNEPIIYAIMQQRVLYWYPVPTCPPPKKKNY
jgi:hypothetical protein